MQHTKRERFESMVAARKQQEAHSLLRDAPRLLDELDTIDRQRGGRCRELVEHARADQTALLKRLDMPLVERSALILIGLRNLCILFNLQRAPGSFEVDISGIYDPADTHYGPAKAAIGFKLTQRAPHAAPVPPDARAIAEEIWIVRMRWKGEMVEKKVRVRHAVPSQTKIQYVANFDNPPAHRLDLERMPGWTGFGADPAAAVAHMFERMKLGEFEIVSHAPEVRR